MGRGLGGEEERGPPTQAARLRDTQAPPRKHFSWRPLPPGFPHRLRGHDPLRDAPDLLELGPLGGVHVEHAGHQAAERGGEGVHRQRLEVALIIGEGQQKRGASASEEERGSSLLLSPSPHLSLFPSISHTSLSHKHTHTHTLLIFWKTSYRLAPSISNGDRRQANSYSRQPRLHTSLFQSYPAPLTTSGET